MDGQKGENIYFLYVFFMFSFFVPDLRTPEFLILGTVIISVTATVQIFP